MRIITRIKELFRKIIPLIFVIVFYMLGCEENELLKKPTVKTLQAENITASTVSVNGEFVNIKDYDVTEFGFCWSEVSNPTISNNKLLIDLVATNINFNAAITGLDPNKTYYLRAFASNDVGSGYGDEISFTTENGNITITTTEVTNVTAKSASAGGNITDDGGSEVTVRGICYSTSQSPEVTDNKVQEDSEGIGAFNCSLESLLPGTTYYLRAFATNEVGTAYGNEVSFSTDDGLPELTTIEISNITTSSAISGGEISDNGGFSITARGVCYDTETLPTISDSHTTDGSGTGSFQSNIEGLIIGTKYYLRAYATNQAGTSYGEEQVFFTDIVDYDNNEYDVVIIGDQIWMAENLRTIHYASGDAMIDGTGVGAIWQDTTTQYYFSYDDNDANVETYGRLYNWAAAMITWVSDVEYSFKIQGACPDGWRMPGDEDWLELETYLGMEQSDVNGFDMRGIDEGGKLKSTSEWASNGNGTDEVGFSVFPAGRRDGDSFKEMFYYTHFWAGIEPYDLQCVDRWFAYDKGGIGRDGVGADGGFSVRCIYGEATPTVSTIEVADVTSSSATVGCYTSSNGGEYVSEGGIYYSTSRNPESTGTKIQISGGLGAHTTNLSGLSPGTTYYVKAYAVNSIGVNYGMEIEFSTSSGSIFFE